MENTKVSKNIVYLVDIIQKEINKQCCLPEGYNADLELEDDNKELLGLKVIGITVTDKDGNQVGGLFKDEKEVAAYFKSMQHISGDTLADEYVKGVQEVNSYPTWDLVSTAFCAGMNEQRIQTKKYEQMLNTLKEDDE